MRFPLPSVPTYQRLAAGQYSPSKTEFSDYASQKRIDELSVRLSDAQADKAAAQALAIGVCIVAGMAIATPAIFAKLL